MGMNKKGGNTGDGAGIIFFNPINNAETSCMWARRVAEDTEGAKEREAKCGLVHELYYESLDGDIETVRTVDKGEFGEMLEILMDDNGERYLLQMPFSSDIGKAFIMRLENIDPVLPIEIGLWLKGKKRILWAKQGDQKVANPYAGVKGEDGTITWAKELPKPIEKKKRGGKSDWDWTEQNDALFELCRDWAIKNDWVKNEEEFMTSPIKAASDDTPAPEPAPDAPPPEDDDVPF